MARARTVRLTTAQAIVRWLAAQRIERDGDERAFFAGCWGIFGHGNLAGIGQALQQEPRVRYYLARNEQAMVHAAVGFAKQSDRLRAFACTSSIGPGATNMVTGAALATIDRLPVLLLPGDRFARRIVDPVLQQLESEATPDVSVNDALRPVSRYWDRVERPEQIVTSLPAAMRVLASPAETGAATVALPQDVQTEAFDFPAELFEPRVWHVPRPRPEPELLSTAVAWIRESRRPLLVAGGGVVYSGATATLARFVERTGIPVAETQAGKGSLPFDHPANVGAMGVTGSPIANRLARDADLVIGVGTRYSDFTTASKTAFQHPDVRFVDLNISAFDAAKHAGLPLVADARAGLEELGRALAGHRVSAEHEARVAQGREEWAREVDRLLHLGHAPLPAQSEVIGAVNEAAGPRDVVVCAAGSLPGDLHRLWRTRDPKGYHVEYGYSCMGYEIAGGLGAKMADPSREVYVLVGDGSYLMMPSEIVTSISERYKLTIVLVENHGFASIGGLSEALGSGGFGTRYRYRDPRTGQLDGELLPVDLAENARSLGAHVVRARTIAELRDGLAEAKTVDRTVVLVVETDPSIRVPSYDAWWDVPVAEVSEMESVRRARQAYEEMRQRERTHV